MESLRRPMFSNGFLPHGNCYPWMARLVELRVAQAPRQTLGPFAERPR